MKKILLFSLAITLFSGTSVKADFPDVPADSEYHQSISALQKLGIVQGYENGQFDQNRLVSRAEFLKMALLADTMDKKLTNVYGFLPVFPGIENVKVDLSCFPDVRATDWFAPYVCWAKKEGVISGYPDGKFNPHQTVNVAEAAKILAKAEKTSAVGHWANGYFQKLAPHTFPTSILKADQLLNRADTAEMTWRYHLATNEQLEGKSSKILVWNEDKFLNLDYIGNTQHYVLGYLYAKDDKNVYGMEYENGNYVPKIIDGADLESFKVYTDEISYLANENENGTIGLSVAADNSHLYVTGEVIPESSGGEFSLFDEVFSNEYIYLFGRDSENVYLIICYEGCHLVGQFPGADPASFEALDFNFSKDKNKVYFLNTGLKGIYKANILEADPNTFEALGNGYAKDAKHVFFEKEILATADPFSFEYLNFPIKNSSCPSQFYKDKDNLFINSKLIPNVDVASFEFLHDYGIFFKDKTHVYRLTREAKGSLCFPDTAIILSRAEVNDFKAFGSNYFVTQDGAYYVNNGGIPIQMQGVDLESFESFSSNESLPYQENGADNFAKDKNSIYYAGKVLNGVDVETFHYSIPLTSTSGSSGWSDKNKAYTWSELTAMAVQL